MIAALEWKKTELETTISVSASKVARLEDLRDRAVAGERATATMAKVVGE